jgi:hypothetical protein
MVLKPFDLAIQRLLASNILSGYGFVDEGGKTYDKQSIFNGIEVSPLEKVIYLPLKTDKKLIENEIEVVLY